MAENLTLSLPGQKALGPLTGQPVQQLQIAQRMLQASSHTAQHHKPAVAQIQALPQGKYHVRIVLFRGQLNHIGVVGHLPQRVKVPHHQVGVYPIGHQRIIPPVGGNDIVPRGRAGAQRQGQGHRAHHIADSVFTLHKTTFLSSQVRAFALFVIIAQKTRRYNTLPPGSLP